MFGARFTFPLLTRACWGTFPCWLWAFGDISSLDAAGLGDVSSLVVGVHLSTSLSFSLRRVYTSSTPTLGVISGAAMRCNISMWVLLKASRLPAHLPLCGCCDTCSNCLPVLFSGCKRFTSMLSRLLLLGDAILRAPRLVSFVLWMSCRGI